MVTLRVSLEGGKFAPLHLRNDVYVELLAAFTVAGARCALHDCVACELTTVKECRDHSCVFEKFCDRKLILADELWDAWEDAEAARDRIRKEHGDSHDVRILRNMRRRISRAVVKR